MKDRKPQKTESKPASKRAYEPPKASYVELKVEERLLACQKYDTKTDCPSGQNNS